MIRTSGIMRCALLSGALKSFWISSGTLTVSWTSWPEAVRNQLRVRWSALPRTLRKFRIGQMATSAQLTRLTLPFHPTAPRVIW